LDAINFHHAPRTWQSHHGAAAGGQPMHPGEQPEAIVAPESARKL
jgi:hypothetical protein